jgi:type I restriction enzyme R subunit
MTFIINYTFLTGLYKRENVRASLRIKIKRLLRKHKYPSEKKEEAIALVLKQDETLSESWMG